MKKKRKSILKWCMTLLLMCSIVLGASGNPATVEAASGGLASYKTVSAGSSCKIGKTVFSMKYNNSTGKYTIYAKKNGKNRVLTKNSASRIAVTNGKNLYYGSGTVITKSRGMSTFRNRSIVKCTVSSRKSRTIKKLSGQGTAYSPIACDGTYLYYGTATQYSDRAVGSFSVLNLNNKKVTRLGGETSEVRKAGNRVLVSGNDFPANAGGPTYLMSRSGKIYQIISMQGRKVRIKGKYIYLSETNNWGRGYETRNFKCTLQGKLVKAY